MSCGVFIIIAIASAVLVAVKAAVGNNVTAMLDHLLDGYDRTLRPGFGGPPTLVKTNILIRSMGPISEKKMVYSMDCYFRQVWRDDRLSFDANKTGVSNVQLSIKMLEKIWYPDTIFLNGGYSFVHTITMPNKFFRLSDDGGILFSQRLTVRASCPMNLKKFPMDKQKCPLHVGSFGYGVRDVLYVWGYGNNNSVEVAQDMTMSQFDLIGKPAQNATQLFKGEMHSILTVFFHLRRHTGYFLIQVYVPCCLLVVLSWVSFFINREATSDRIALGIMTMLTMTFLALDSRDDLPRLSYNTAMDIYIAACFLFVFATILQFAAVHHFTKYGTEEVTEGMPPSSDEESEEENTTYLPSTTVPKCRRPQGEESLLGRCLECLGKMASCLFQTRTSSFNKHVRNALGLNSVSMIDKVARVIFPLSFTGFNIIYWICYFR